jgi:hypothetical protein
VKWPTAIALLTQNRNSEMTRYRSVLDQEHLLLKSEYIDPLGQSLSFPLDQPWLVYYLNNIFSL